MESKFKLNEINIVTSLELGWDCIVGVFKPFYQDEVEDLNAVFASYEYIVFHRDDFDEVHNFT